MLSEKEKNDFAVICDDAGRRREAGIGTLGEKTLHRVLKRFFCPPECVHEVKLCGHVADAILGGTVYEIQTGGLHPLKKKLLSYKENTDHHIRIVLPVLKKKRIVWIDPDSGEMRAPRGTGVGLGKWRVLAEMVYLLPVFDFSRMSLTLAYIAADDYKLLDGYGEDKKKRATRYERIPTALLDICHIDSKEAFVRHFMPADLPAVFTSADFARATRLRRRGLWAGLRVLLELGAIRAVGKEGNAILYEKNSEA